MDRLPSIPLLLLLLLQLLDSLLQSLDLAIGMREGCCFHSTTVAALPIPILTIRAGVATITLYAMNTAPVAGSGDLASFLSGSRRRLQGQLKLRRVRRGRDTGRRHAGEGSKHGLESPDEKWRPLEKERRGAGGSDGEVSRRQNCGVQRTE